MFFHSLPNELWWLIMLSANFIGILTVYRFFGRVGLFIWIPLAAVLANIQVVKLVELAGITATLGNIVYATSFLATDILSENYGKKSARSAVVIGFFSLITATVLMNIALGFTPSPEDEAHQHLAYIFGLMPRITFASLTAYGLAQLHDIWAYDFWRRRFPSSKYIWIRNNVSTMVSQLLDTLVFNVLAFAGLFSLQVFIEITITTYLLKWLVAALDTPLVYISRRWYEKGQVQELEHRLGHE